MKIATLLYGQPRTFKYTFSSIERLFKQILNTDFYVILNENTDTHFSHKNCDGQFSNLSDLLTSDEIDNMINRLNPIVYEKVNINKTTVFNELSKNMNTELISNFFYTSWDEYKKMPCRDKIYDIDSCIKNNCKLNLMDPANFLKIFIEFNNVEQYIRNKLLFLVRKTNIEYTHIFLIRTDTIWFETFEQLMTILKTDKYLSYEAPTISNDGLVKNLNNFNDNINELKYLELTDKIKEMIEEKKDAISLYNYNDELNFFIPIEQQGFYCYNNIILKEIIDSSLGWEDYKTQYIKYILNHYSKYPLIGPNWEGELHQCKRHILMNNNISKKFQLSHYSRIIRNKKL
jgi:hypothetical protein